MAHPIINTIGLCSGIGMLEEAIRLGCEFFGWRTRPACLAEWESYAASVLLARMEESSLEPCPIWCGDLRDFDAKPFRGVVDILTAGLPCQPYSVAGKQGGLSDQRSYGDGDGPIPHFLRIVGECRPAVVFIENVPPFVAGLFDKRAGKRNYPFLAVGAELSGMGYVLSKPLIVSAEAIGASHGRKRVFVLAHAASWDRRKFAWSNQRRRMLGLVDASGVLGDSCQSRLPLPELNQLPGSEQFDQGRATRQSNRTSLFAPGPAADWGRIPEMLYPVIEPGFCVLADGMAVVVDEGRADQLRCGGNGVVATAAAVAFVELMRRII